VILTLEVRRKFENKTYLYYHFAQRINNQSKMKLKKFFRGLSTKPNPYFLERLITAVAIVMVWRGMWNLLDTYFFPQHKILSDILSVVIGLILLYLPDDGEIKDLI